MPGGQTSAVAAVIGGGGTDVKGRVNGDDGGIVCATE